MCLRCWIFIKVVSTVDSGQLTVLCFCSERANVNRNISQISLLLFKGENKFSLLYLDISSSFKLNIIKSVGYHLEAHLKSKIEITEILKFTFTRFEQKI